LKRLVLIATVVWIALPAAAQAAFSAPQEVAAASGFHRGFVAAADASGRVTVATRAAIAPPRYWNVARLIEHPPDGGWADLPLVPGTAPHRYVDRSAISAAGDGALGVAWVVSGPTKYSGSILVAVREPGGTLSDPIVIAGPEADGVDDVAIAVDAAGDVLLAYKTGTRASHLGMQGAIAVAYRPAGRSSFIGPTIVDQLPSNVPVVALAEDGSGIVTWTRRQILMAATIGAHGAVGAAKPIAQHVFVARPVAAAGPRGAASVAYRANTTHVRGKHYIRASAVYVVAQPAGRSFGEAKRVFRGSGWGRDLSLTADEQGRATLAWTDQPFQESRGPVVPGVVRIAAGRVGGRFGRSRVVGPRQYDGFESASVAARNGHVALAWGTVAEDQRIVEAAAGPWDAALTPQRIRSKPPVGPVAVTMAGDGRVTALWRAGQLWASDGP
jgi:hypothetical protein